MSKVDVDPNLRKRYIAQLFASPFEDEDEEVQARGFVCDCGRAFLLHELVLIEKSVQFLKFFQCGCPHCGSVAIDLFLFDRRFVN